MAERRMPDVVDQRQRLRQRLIEPQSGGNGARDLRDLHSVGQPAAEVIGRAVRKDLRLAGEAAEGTGMNDARAVAVKCGPIRMRRFEMLPLAERSLIGDRAGSR
ncbi:hypothetical protein GCM10011586_07440 [Silvibacterium dinghuense]|nr:hypothetical protein GCM10011586_07440 [Silvibacterium dinghuense]